MTLPLFRPCAVIPIYNHGATVGAVVAALRQMGLPCILVDDGSDAACAALLDALAAESVTVLHRPANGGKGAAVHDGMCQAAMSSYTHALQIDADGQHDLGDVQTLLARSRAEPDALICGRPVYGADAPRARLYGRWITRVWVWINTLSCDIPDAMCGFRIYPLARSLPAMSKAGRRMDFDIGIVVRLHWAGVPMRWIATRVRYPEGSISHFRMLADNVLISRMHARLFFGMLLRSPLLLLRKLRSAP